MIVGGIHIEGHRKDLSNRVYRDKDYEGSNTIRELYLNGTPFMMACNKMIRLDFLRQNNLYFVEGIIHEDNPWSFYLANTINSMALCSSVTYIYYLRSDSIMSVLSNSKRMKRYDSLMRILGVYDEGFRNERLARSKGNIHYFTRLKYDYITEITSDPNVTWKYKIKCIQYILNEKWTILFILKWTELFVKTRLWRMLHKE